MNPLLTRARGAVRSREVGAVVEALTQASIQIAPGAKRERLRRALPSRDALERIVADLRAVLFPLHFGPSGLSQDEVSEHVAKRLEAALTALEEQARRGLLLVCAHTSTGASCGRCSRSAAELTNEFVHRLPAVRALLESDARAAYEGDPAATSADEAIFCYPGMAAITQHRLAHELYLLGVPLIPRIIAELAHGATGIDIHPGATIGGSFFIDHGTGVVIGETSVVGERVRLYQGVTLGARSFPTDADGRSVKGTLRHPIVEDDVIIYSGATILGRITIGRGSSIGGNVWLTRSVPPGSRITQAQVRDDLFDGGSGI
jgi:serine O-acetyltransferase